MLALINAFLGYVEPIFSKLGIPAEDVRSGFESIHYGIARLALEVGQAESQGVPISEAVRNGEDFPIIHRFHHGVFDILSMNLPPELTNLAKQIIEMPQPEFVEEIRLYLARLACTLSMNTPERALA